MEMLDSSSEHIVEISLWEYYRSTMKPILGQGGENSAWSIHQPVKTISESSPTSLFQRNSRVTKRRQLCAVNLDPVDAEVRHK